jgi:sugar phosphate isomerase/epimerase
VETAAEIGASIVQVVVEDAVLHRALDRFTGLCERAAPQGLTVSLEFMKWRSLPTLQKAREFVLAAGRANANLCVDCLHLSRCGNAPADVADLPSGFVGYVQLCDAPHAIPPDDAIVAEARGGRMFPGDGELWLHALLDLLPDGTPLSLEVPRQQDARRSARERAQLAAKAMHRFLECRSDRGSAG